MDTIEGHAERHRADKNAADESQGPAVVLLLLGVALREGPIAALFLLAAGRFGCCCIARSDLFLRERQ